MGAVLVTLAVGLSLAIPAWLGLPERDVPTVLRPLPLPTLVAAFYFVDRGWSLGSVTVLPSMLFFLWHARLFQGIDRVPKRTYVLWTVVTILSIAWFAIIWREALRFHSFQHLLSVGGINLTWAASVGALLARNWRGPSSFGSNLLLHWALFAWLAWYAFPVLGELP
jgi:hypothetical protein